MITSHVLSLFVMLLLIFFNVNNQQNKQGYVLFRKKEKEFKEILSEIQAQNDIFLGWILPYLLHISQCDGLCLVPSVGPALPCVPSDAGDPGGWLSQSVEQRHLFGQTEGAEVGLVLTRTLLFYLHCGHRLGALDLAGILHLLGLSRLLPRGGALLRRCLQAEGQRDIHETRRKEKSRLQVSMGEAKASEQVACYTSGSTGALHANASTHSEPCPQKQN